MPESLANLLISIKAHPVLNPQILFNQYTQLDLSVFNADLNSVNVSSSKELQSFIFNSITANNSKIGFGGYLEHRNIYSRSKYFNQNNPSNERNIHIGLDLWTVANAAVYAPLDGEIHSFKNNRNYGDYGPTIVLKHSVKGVTFYTLYGHLSLESIKNKAVGDKISRGDKIATLGTPEVNGDYPPHLHFQIIRDIQKYEGDYPGVINKSDLEFYKNNCPDPSLLLKLQ